MQKSLPSYLLIVMGIFFITVFGLFVNSFLGISPVNIVMMYLVAVVFVAFRLGYGPAIFASSIGALTFDFFFIPPQLTFVVSDTQYVITFIGLFTVGVVIAKLSEQARTQTEIIKRREQETSELYALSQDLLSKVETRSMIPVILEHVRKTIECHVTILLIQNNEVYKEYSTLDNNLNTAEHNAAIAAIRNNRVTGRDTLHHSSVSGKYYPLQVGSEMYGVMGVFVQNHLLPEQNRLLEAFVAQASLALETASLAEKARQTELIEQKENLQTIILNSISHDLRTPLVSITGTLSSLKDDEDYLTPTVRQELVQGAYEEANRLNHLVTNLLEMSRLQAGSRPLKQEYYDIYELFTLVRSRYSDSLDKRDIQFNVEEALPLIYIDLTLFSQVIINLLDNAIKYSPSGSKIEIRAYIKEDNVYITIKDYGVGIPEEELPYIFDKFYRASSASGKTGTGLGLPICKGIVELHGGTIHAESSEGGGTQFTIICCKELL